MALLCITNQMPDWKPCTVRGTHDADCDGWEYRWSEDHHRDEATGRECAGCVPREARHGHLCNVCWDKLQHALAEWTPARAQLLRTIDRAVQRDTGGRSSGPEGYVPIPGTMLAVDEIESYLKGSPARADYWVANEAGAENAVRFARAVPAALRTHELEERAHRIQRVRCPECKRLSLVWNPPAYETDHVKVRCTNDRCAAEIDQTAYAALAEIEGSAQPRRGAA